MHRQVAVATIFVCLVTPLFSAAFAQSCPPPTPPPISLLNAEICAWATDQASTTSGLSSYSWTISHGTIIASDNGGHVSFSSDGSGDVVLSVDVTDANGCVSTNSVTVPIHSIDSPAITAPLEMCPFGSADLSVSAPAGGGSWTSISWNVTNGYFQSDTYPYQLTYSSEATPHLSSNGQGAVSVQVSVADAEGCSASATVNIGVRSIQPPVITAPTEMCPYGSGDLSVSPPAEGGEWKYVSWSVINGYFQSDTYPYQSPWAYGPTARVYSSGFGPTTVQVDVGDSLGCDAHASATIGVRSIQPPVITAPTELCPMGAGDLSVSAPAEGGAWKYVSWSVINGYFQSDTYPYQSLWAYGPTARVYASGSGPTTVQVDVGDSLGCDAHASATIGVRSIQPPVITAPTELCPYTSGDLSVGPPAEGGEWRYVSWSVTNGYFQSDTYPYQSPWAYGPTARVYSNGSGPMTVQVDVGDSLGCENHASATIGEKQIAPPPINVAASVCSGVNSTASIDGAWAWVSWSIQNGYFIVGGNHQTWASDSNVVFVADGSGPVTLAATVGDSGHCTGTSTATVALANPAPVISVATVPVPTDTTDTAQIDSSYTSVQWSITNGTILAGANGNSVTFQAAGSEPVTLAVSATDAAGCSGTASVQYTTAGHAVAITAPASFCSTSAVKTATAFSNGTLSNIQWTIANGTIISGANTESVSFTPSSFNDVTLTLNANVNGSPATATKVVPYQPPAIQATWDHDVACKWRYTNVSVTNAADLAQLSIGIQNGSLGQIGLGYAIQLIANSDTTPVTLTLTGTTNDGCPVSYSHTFGLPQKGDLSFSTTSLCAGGTQTATLTNASAFQSWSWGITGGAFDTTVGPGNEPAAVTYHATGSGPVTLNIFVYNGNDSCGVSTNYTIPVDVPPTPAVSTSGPTTFCAGGSVTLTASSASSYLWSNGATTQAITVNTAGNYSVTATDAGGCSATSAATSVTVTSTPTPAITPQGPTMNLCPNHGVTLVATAGAYGYLWSNGMRDQSIIAWAPGSYTVTTSDANGCSATSAPVVVTFDNPPVPVISANGPTTFCPGGSVTLTSSITNEPLRWSNGQTAASIVVTTPGTYWVSANDGTCDGSSNTITVTVGGSVTPTITGGESHFLCGGSSVTLTSSPASAYLWSNGATTQSIAVTTDGDYTVTTTDAYGCSATSAPRTIIVDTPFKPTVTSSAPGICPGGTVTLTSSSATGNRWSDGETTQSITVSAAGSYTVTVTDTYGCTATSDVVTIAVDSPPAPTITPSGPTTFCQGTTVSLTSSAGVSYLWSNGSTSRTIVIGLPGNYTVTVTDASGCSATSAATSVTVNPPPVATVDVPASICINTTGHASVNETFASYRWQVTNNAQILGGTTSRNVSFRTSNSTPFTLSVTVTDSNGCSSTRSVTVGVNPLPTPQISGAPSICVTDTGSLNVTNPTAGSSWTWSLSNATILGVFDAQGNPNPNGSRVTYQPSAAGQINITLTETNANGCRGTATGIVVANAPAPADFTAGAVCPGATGTASSNSPYAVYSWSITNGTILSGANAHDVTFRASTDVNNPTTLTLTTTSYCVTPQTKTVPWSTIPPPYITLASQTVCPATNSYATVADSYGSYAWTITNGTIVSGANTHTVTYTAGASGNVGLTLVVNSGGCSSSSTVNVPIEDTTPPAITAPDTICYLGTFTASVPAGYDHYAWWYDNVTEVSVVPNSNSVMLRSDGTGRPIDLRVTMWRDSGAGCQVVATKTVTYAATPTPTIGFSVPANFCTGMTGQASVTNGPYTSYAWTISGGAISGPANGSTVSFIPDGSATPQLTVQVTDGRGNCTATGFGSSPFANFKPTVYSSNGVDICASATTTLSLYGSSTPDSYLWSTGATTPTISVNTAGDYTLTTSINGCSMTSAPLHINVHPVSAAITADKTTYCAGATPASLSVTNTSGFTGQARTIYWYATDSQSSIGGGYQVYGHTASNYTRTYYAVVSDENGCSATTNQITITVNPLPAPAITASGRTTICAGGSVTLTASAASSYLWSNGATTQAITVNASGSYSVTVTDANGCSATSAATSVTVDTPPAPTISASGPTTFCAGGNVTLTASSGSSYLWSNGATTQSIIVNASGNYSVTVTDSNGCSATSQATTVTAFALPAPTISASGATTFCAGGSVTLTASSAASYHWSTGATTQAITVNANGNYSVTVTDANGCSATSAATAVTANALPAPTISASGPTTFCAGGSVTLTASSASSYLWSNGATTRAITVNASANYSVTVTDANGCSATSAATAVTVNALPAPTISASGPTTFCASGSVTLTASSASSYLWSNGATTQSIIANASGNYSVTVTDSNGCSATSQATTVTAFALPAPTISASGPTTFCTGGSVTLTASSASSYLWSNGATTASIVVNTSGNYSVTVIDANGCSATSAARSVTVNALPAPTISASGPTTFCTGGSVTLTASSASSYLWSNGATTASIVVNASGNYSVTVTDANGCSATSAARSVTVNALPTPTISASGPTTFCAGGNVTLTASSASSYLWSNGATTASIVVNASGNYSVTVTDANGCSATSAARSVTVNALPAPTISASGPTTFCAGGSVTLTASAASSYLWSNGATTQAITVNASGNYSVTVTDANGCSATSAATNVTGNSNPAPSITAPSAICSGGSGNASTTAISGATYAWTITNGTITSGSGTSAITFTSTSGPVTLGVTVTSNSCGGSANATVNVNAVPNATITAPSAFCSGASATASVAAVAGATYSWTITNGTITGGSGTNAITFTSASGPVSLGVTVTSNGCSATGSKSVTVNPLPNATITAPSAICSGATGAASVATISGGSYNWTITGGTITGGSGTNAITFTSASGTVALGVTVTSNGCSSTGNANVAVNANPATPTISAGGPTTFCQGSNVTLSAPASSAYHWSDGETTQSIVVSASGTYTVSVTNASGCTSAQSAPVSVTVNPATTITQQPGSISITHNTHTTLSVTATGTGTLTYQWYNPPTANNNDTSKKVGGNSPTFTTPNLAKGTFYYYVVVTGSCGTVRSAIATVTSN